MTKTEELISDKLKPVSVKDKINTNGSFWRILGTLSIMVAIVSAVISGFLYRRALECKDIDAHCEYHAANEQCKQNPIWMIQNCPLSCNYCEMRDDTRRCTREKLLVSNEPTYKAGDMDRIFSEIPYKFAHYGVNVLSSPNMRDGMPWIITFDNFLSNAEVDAFLQTNRDFTRSTELVHMPLLGDRSKVSGSRTSSVSWCFQQCRQHPLVQSVLRKIENVTSVPHVNYESFQVLKYEVGQQYKEHHDFISKDLRLPAGPRILTFFLYLSDVEEGGETSFPSLGIDVKPKKGKAVLWPNALSSQPDFTEPLTKHEAKPVIRGTKYGANSWIHNYNYDVPYLWGCTG